MFWKAAVRLVFDVPEPGVTIIKLTHSDVPEEDSYPPRNFDLSRKSKYGRPKMELTLTRSDDWHLHLRDADLLQAVAPHSAKLFGRAIVMPNLKPPITTTAAVAYGESILKALLARSNFTPLMTIYLTDKTSPNEIKLARRKSGVVFAVKLYPAGATTNSQDGVTDLFGKCLLVLEEMVEANMPLLYIEVLNVEVLMLKFMTGKF
ncbi:dihydroorotase, mitochondrial-like [Hibiscus syriacus]|uniref:dihydroorotase, mitochondrial-like n=1 Tax=Hibiscus syriacus TaxID=106335 RepID=UPI001924CBD7|nr:dihydroorotase, mitochondrial-like [Hibiscus syriacus]